VVSIPEELPAAIESAYDLGAVNPDVLLRESGFALSSNAKTLTLQSGRVFISSKPSLRLCFDGSGPAPEHGAFELALGDWQPTEIRLEPPGLAGRVFVGTSIGGVLGETARILSAAGQIVELTEGGGELDHVLFQLPNFCDYHGRGSRRGSNISYRRLELRAGGWLVVLDARQGIRELLDDIRDEGGYAFTHVGMLSREDGGDFSATDAVKILDALHWFLSFVRGIWVAPIVAEGYSDEGIVIWRRWGAGHVSRWAGPPSWCDLIGWSAAQEAFVGFLADWDEPFTNSLMRTAVGQYVSANRPDPVEVAIVVAQSGLELLGWTRFVESGALTKDDWKKLRAAEKITMLLEPTQVDREIPDAAASLRGLDANWQTGPEAVAGVRNRLVHPSRKADSSSWPGEVLADAWLLSSRYLELALLHRMGVESPIRDRLNPNVMTGSVAPPPWAE
jgi:hypothetical protein